MFCKTFSIFFILLFKRNFWQLWSFILAYSTSRHKWHILPSLYDMIIIYWSKRSACASAYEVAIKLCIISLSSLSLTQWNGGIKLPHIYVGERFFYPPGKGNDQGREMRGK